MLHKTGPGQVAVADGAICPQMVKCGKPSCKCARGELHRAFYLFWRERGRPRKAYVRQADLGPRARLAGDGGRPGAASASW